MNPFKKPPYPIIYHPSFCIFFGIILAVTVVYLRDLLYTAYALFFMLMLISHEHAHAVECIRHGVRIHSIEFSFWGGFVNAEIERDPGAAVDILKAGVRDTAMYGAGFVVLLGGMFLFGPIYSNGNVFLTFPLRDFLWWSGQAAILTFIGNIIPGTIHHKVHGAIRTDGWAAWKYRELRDELWNDGKVTALFYQ